MIIHNFTDALQSQLEINPSNAQFLKSDYVARTSKELPVLMRWFDKSEVQKYLAKAKFLDIILYSCEQTEKEH